MFETLAFIKHTTAWQSLEREVEMTINRLNNIQNIKAQKEMDHGNQTRY